MIEKNVNNLKELHWACRRGMLELDVLLGNFLKEAYPDLSLTDKASFVELLTHPDPVLFAWLLGQIQPDDQALAHIVTLIRHHAQSRI
ncbi:MAG TPA: succinate dehydrogenase assembly factor 2 [Gammaproteobacteria bacterium]|jgi:antitoxin CptB|nr:succinate dehydrogenase assembly factor 2 [Gammaproteobacteria bacterium]